MRRLIVLTATTTLLFACGRDAPDPAVDIEIIPAPPAAPGAPLDALDDSVCGVAVPAFKFEVLDAPAAGRVADVRLRWPADAPLPSWDCCPYQRVIQPFADGGALIKHAPGADAEGQYVDLEIAVDDAPGATLTVGVGVCSAQRTHTWTIAPSPFAGANAALATCDPVDDQIDFDARQHADLRVTAFEIEGAIAPGATIELNVALAEVAGVGHGYYPGFIFEFDPPVVELNQSAGVFYATFACEPSAMTVPVQLPDDLEPGTTLTIIAKAGEPLCRDGDCHINDVASLTRRVVAAP